MKLTILAGISALALSPLTLLAQPGTGTQPEKPAPKAPDKEKPRQEGEKPRQEEKPGQRRGKQGGPSIGDPAPAWTLKDSAGKEHKLADYKGKIVVMDFWATWCPPCKKAMPDVQKLHEAYKDKGVAVFGVNTWEKGDAAKYMSDNKYTYGLLMKGDDVAKDYGVTGIPVFIIVGPDGTVIYKEVGYDPKNYDKMVKVIDEALKNKA
ncbi:MAG TPA: redoxin domain-containing protein [Phycisphaerales bacterium]|nr:redoxin domain-containing protein [Phycisphaerales bacterium]